MSHLNRRQFLGATGLAGATAVGGAAGAAEVGGGKASLSADAVAERRRFDTPTVAKARERISDRGTT